MTAQDLADRLQTLNPLVIGHAVYVPIYRGWDGVGSMCLRECMELSGIDDEELWARHQPFLNVPGYWVIVAPE